MSSAFGCGAFKHRPEEVARIFKEEIDAAGVGLPFIVFAVIDNHYSMLEHNPTGNSEVFSRIFDQGMGYDANWKAPTTDDASGNLEVGEAGGPGAGVIPGPIALSLIPI